ncbi:MAG: CHAT domain-containing protein [Oscillochloris sp.]|nr:CHAT domain-containing protein [Oscillochloris sp.]
MSGFADLELGLSRRPDGRYTAELRFITPNDDTDNRLIRDDAPIEINQTELIEHAVNPSKYGGYLFGQLFKDQKLHQTFESARAVANSLSVPLRLRLAISPNAPELHGFRWETLRDEANSRSLFTDEQLLFSRYLSSSDWRPIKLRPKGDLRALVAIANPMGLERWGMAAVDVAGEQARALTGLSSMPTTVLATKGSANLDNILNQMRDGIDIFYLVCHGSLKNGRPILYLEDEKNQLKEIAGEDFVERVRELSQRPRLIVLASCQSAGTSTGEDVLLALGPRLAEAGIPAVLAMQGQISMETNAAFMPAFFSELNRDGQIDRAMAVARGKVRSRADSWMPVLIMRLKSGRIWYVPGSSDDKGNFDKWPTLIRNITTKKGTPILGPGLVEPLMGSTREIAQRWADQFVFPMAPYERENLPQVAQYLAVNQDLDLLRDEFIKSLRHEMLRQYGEKLGADIAEADLKDLITAVGKAARDTNSADPHKVLASFKLPLYITTNFDTLLEDALREAGCAPQSIYCPWNSDLTNLPQTTYDANPDPKQPLVYHLFGMFEEPLSLVLTEDDYFDYLIAVTSDRELIPGVVQKAITDSPLLFLGFHVDDWDFRILFRSFKRKEGGSRRTKLTHIAAQIDPEEGRTIEPERARRYLEKYFDDEKNISIYWGTSEDFIRDLASRPELRQQ